MLRSLAPTAALALVLENTTLAEEAEHPSLSDYLVVIAGSAPEMSEGSGDSVAAPQAAAGDSDESPSEWQALRERCKAHRLQVSCVLHRVHDSVTKSDIHEESGRIKRLRELCEEVRPTHSTSSRECADDSDG